MPNINANADALHVYATGAPASGGYVDGIANSLGGYRSALPVHSVEVERVVPINGIVVWGASGQNGIGTGVLTAPTADTLTWKAPGGTTGTAVTIANGEYKIVEDDTASKYIIVQRISADDLQGSESCSLRWIRNNGIAMENVSNADAVAGAVNYIAVMLRNESSSTITGLKIWLGTSSNDLRIAYETPSTGAIQTIADNETAPTGVTWNTGTTSGTGISIATLAAGDEVGLWIERTIDADTTEGVDFFSEILCEFVGDGAATFSNTLYGLYSIARDNAVGYGFWVGQDDYPDNSAAPDEFFTTKPYTTTMTFAAGHTYYWFTRNRNQYGLYEYTLEVGSFVVNADGELGFTPPSAPENIEGLSTTGGAVRVRGTYFPIPDGVNRAEIFVLWLDIGSDPDPSSDTPVAYQQIPIPLGAIYGQAIEFLDITTDATYLDATPVHVIPRTRRVEALASGETSDSTQLGASGGGTITCSAADFSALDSTGFLKITAVSGRLREYVAYSAKTGTTFTIDAAGRGIWGSTAAAGEDTDLIIPVTYVDSTNTTATTVTVNTIGPSMPKGVPFFSPIAAQQQGMLGPDGTAIAVPGGDGWYWEMRAGDTRLYDPDDGIVLRVLYNSENVAGSGLYVESGYDVDLTVASGSTTETDETTDADNYYVAVNGTRLLHVDRSAAVVYLGGLNLGYGSLPDVHPQTPVHGRYADTMLQVWDISTDDYVPWCILDASGVLGDNINLYLGLNEASILALEVP